MTSPPKPLKSSFEVSNGRQLHDYLLLEIVDLLPDKTRILLPDAIRREVIINAVIRFGSKEKLAKFLGLNRKVPRWWEKGTYRPSIAQLKKLGVSKQVLSMAENFGLEGSKKSLRLPKQIVFDETFAWFLGLRDGDSDETSFDVGIGNSDPEILLRAVHFFRTFSIEEKQVWLYISSARSDLDSVKEKWSKELGYQKIE